MTLVKADLENNTEYYIMGHDPATCMFPNRCVLHNRSDHHMRGWTQIWRGDRAIMERICPHGIGHPDPDQWYFWVMMYGESSNGLSQAHRIQNEMVHGCDGCCNDAYVIQELANMETGK